MSFFATIESAVADIRSGAMVVVVDDEHRENEGDLVMAASKVTADDVNFMARYGRGLICAPLSEDVAALLDLEPMVDHNTDPVGTNFTVSVDWKEGTTTGISMFDRAKTIAALSDAGSKPEDFSRPGHIFPLVAKSGGVLARKGHTEATVDLARLAGLPPVGVLCEIINDDGHMARLPDLMKFSRKHGLKLITIQDLVAFRCREESKIKRVPVSA